MMNFIRKHTQTIVWLIVFVFIVWGGSSLIVSQSRGTSYAGKAFGKKVTHKEFNDAFKMANIFADETLSAGKSSEDKAWVYLVLRHEADKRNIKVPDEEVKGYIAAIFAKRGGMDLRSYESWVRNILREDPRNFEEQARSFLKIQKLLRELAAEFSEDNQPDANKIENWIQEAIRQADIRRYQQ